MHVHELMTHTPGVCTTTDHLTRAAQIMWERDCGAVPVLDGAGLLIGIVTDRDLCMAAYTRGRPLHEIGVAEVMSKVLYTVGPDARLADALDALQRHAVRRLPVTDAQGRLLGILSLADFARAARSWRKSAASSDLLAALESVSRARDPEGDTAEGGAALATKVIVPAARAKRAKTTTVRKATAAKKPTKRAAARR